MYVDFTVTVTARNGLKIYFTFLYLVPILLSYLEKKSVMNCEYRLSYVFLK